MLQIRFTDHVLHENSDLLMKFRKEDEEKCTTNRAEWMSSSVLHCNVTVVAWRRENTRDVGAAL